MMERVVIQLPANLKTYLDDLRCHGYTAAGYIRGLLETDRTARLEAGWQPGKGWTHPDYLDLEPPYTPKSRQRKAR